MTLNQTPQNFGSDVEEVAAVVEEEEDHLVEVLEVPHQALQAVQAVALAADLQAAVHRGESHISPSSPRHQH